MEDQQIYRSRDGKPSPFEKLNTLWNTDKHRLPVLVGSVASGVLMGPGRQDGPIKKVDITTDNYEVVVTTEGEGNLNPEFLIDVAFPEINEIRAGWFLRQIERNITREVLPRFAPFLK